jgi:hypothetical protein
MSRTKYRDDDEITRTLELVRKMWQHNNFLNLGELLSGICSDKDVDIHHLTDIQLQNYIIHYLQCTSTESKK